MKKFFPKHLFVSILLVILSAGGTVWAQSTDFTSFSLGTVHYQGTGGTTVTGAGYTIPSPYGSLWTLADEWGFKKALPAFDEEVKDDGTGNKVWRFSNAVTNNSFSFHPNSPNSPLPAGETTAFLWNDRGPLHTAPTGPNPRAAAATKYFHGGFRFKSATGAPQAGLALNISPTARQSDRRNSFLSITDNGTLGFNLGFVGTGVGGAFPATTIIASNLSYTTWHQLDMYVEFVDGLNGDGSGNDIVTVLLNGVVIHTGTTWETFYRVATPTRPIGAVDALMFRSSGTAVPGTSGNGFYFDDVVYDNAPSPCIPEICDGLDNDCDGDIDEDLPLYTYYFDADEDGYGDPATCTKTCSATAPEGYVANNYDCDDTKKANKPEDEKVIMCHKGKQHCVKAKDINKHLEKGWTLGPCVAANCGPEETLMCNNKGEQECVKNKDVDKKLEQGWSTGACPCDEEGGGGLMRGITSRGEETMLIEDLRVTAFPNPLNQSTTIRYELPADSKVNITLYDPMGRMISTLVDGSRTAGIYNYDLDASRMAAGIYYYKVAVLSGGKTMVQTNKLVIIK